MQITPMLDRLLNNRKEWNALKEIHEAKLAKIEEAKKAKEEAEATAAAAKQGENFKTVLSISLIHEINYLFHEELIHKLIRFHLIPGKCLSPQNIYSSIYSFIY